MIEKYALIRVIQSIIRKQGEFTLRKAAKIAKVSPSAAKNILDFLLAQGTVEKRIEGRNHLFRIKNTVLTRQIKILYSLCEINASGLVDELIKKNLDTLNVILYGSVAKGEDDEKSDIDVLIITRKKSRPVMTKSEKKLTRELTLLQYTHQEWKEKAEKDKVFYRNVILHCIPLYGENPVVD